MPNTLILIPARMASTRLPGKPLADIAGLPMIVQVMRRAEEANLGPVIIACAETEIADAITQAGGKAICTDPGHPSGTDRIFEALQQIDPEKKYQKIINVQGDLPTLDPLLITQAVTLLDNPNVDIGTLAAEIQHDEERTNPNVVKAVIAATGQALYFSRSTVPHGEGPHYHHIGLYAYRREALERFVTLPPSPLEQREKLEQLRALENGMRIDAAVVQTVPLGVDTLEDLERARKLLKP